MSIRLLLNGHNFSQASAAVRAFRGLNPDAQPVVVVDTDKTVLVPAYLAEEGVEEAYLRFNGSALSSGESVVTARTGDIVALMAVNNDICNLVRGEWGENAVFSSPLLEIASGGKRTVNIFLTADNAYLAVVDKELKTAEVLPDPSADSLIYYLQVVGRSFKLKKFDIFIDGAGAEEAVSELAQYYRNVRVGHLCK